MLTKILAKSHDFNLFDFWSEEPTYLPSCHATCFCGSYWQIYVTQAAFQSKLVATCIGTLIHHLQQVCNHVHCSCNNQHTKTWSGRWVCSGWSCSIRGTIYVSGRCSYPGYIGMKVSVVPTGACNHVSTHSFHFPFKKPQILLARIGVNTSRSK